MKHAHQTCERGQGSACIDGLQAHVIIEKAYEGVRKDHVKDELDMFVDFMAIFVSPPLHCMTPIPAAG